MNITIFGSGYVGLVAAACFAEVGHHVVCVDRDADKINQLKQGVVSIYEPGLADMLQRNYQAGRISYTTEPAVGIQQGQFLLIAVGTPSGEDGSADLQYVLEVAAHINQYVAIKKLDDIVVINKSTVPVGTGDKIEQILDSKMTVVSNPEFLREGSAIQDFMVPDRIIIGTQDKRVCEKITALYAPFNPEGTKIVFMSRRSAELTKYAANSLLATKISFMNEMSHLADALGADIESVRQGMSLDKRIGPHFIQAGCGYGGSCFPKDVRALIKSAEMAKVPHALIRAVHDVNVLQKQVLFQKVSRYFKGDLSHKRIAVWGLAFKPNTDDMREAASIPFIQACLQEGAFVQAYDPRASQKAMCLFENEPNFKVYSDPYVALEAADALVLITEWSLFRELNIPQLETQLKGKAIFDGRNLYNPTILRAKGFYYEGIGR